MREVSNTGWLQLTRTNYREWVVTMKVKLRARRLWNTIDKGTDNKEDDMLAMEAILAVVPTEYREPLGVKKTVVAWEAIAVMRVGSDRAKKVMAHLLKQEYANLKFMDGDSFCLSSLIRKLASHDITIGIEDAISKYLHSVLAKYVQIALTIDTMLDLSTLTIEDATEHLRAVDERMEQVMATMDTGKPLLTEEWAAQMEKKAEAHLVQADDDDEATLMVVMFCALPDIEVKEKAEEVVEVEQGKASTVNLHKPRAHVHLGRAGGEQELRWYLDTGADNHMTGSKSAFTKLDGNVTDMVKFGDGSRVVI
jgi:hypothetical protein